jgi:chromosome segregation ATPase
MRGGPHWSSPHNPREKLEMNLKELKPAYTVHDMVKVLRRVDQLTRENNSLLKQVARMTEQLQASKDENESLTAQLFDLQGDFARRMTTACVLPLIHPQE